MKENEEEEAGKKRARTNVFLTFVCVSYTSDLCKHTLVNLQTHTTSHSMNK